MEEPQPSMSRSAVINESDESRPSTSRSAVEVEPRPSTSHSVVEDEPPAKRHLCVEEVRGMWNLVKVYRQLGTREQAVAFAAERGMIAHQKICNYHKQPMKIEYSTNKTVGSFVCNRRPCRGKSKVSRGKGTWFDNIKIQLSQVFYIMYAYSANFSFDRTIKEDFSEAEGISRSTINNWFNYCREAVVAYQTNKQTVTGKIGGHGKVVKIGESKFMKRKYNKGRPVEGHWILRMIEDGSEDLRLEVCPDDILSAEVLVPLIKKHVAEGTTIHTDFWRAYDCLGDHGFIRRKVNHSDPDNPFVDVDGTNTLRIESQWRVIKQFFYKHDCNNCANISDLIYEYIWRRDIEKNKRDAFEELINVINYGYNK